jgi:hypothetical protein
MQINKTDKGYSLELTEVIDTNIIYTETHFFKKLSSLTASGLVTVGDVAKAIQQWK